MSTYYNKRLNREAQEGDLRVWNMVNFENKYIYVKNKEEAKKIVEALTIVQLQDDNIECNALGLQVHEDIGEGEGLQWYEWYDDKTGITFDEWMEEQDAKKE
ncbi:TPA: hypothetical protein ACGXNJ_005254 [Bacillus cereus]